MEDKKFIKNQDFQQKALDYHAQPQPGKFATKILKPIKNRDDFGLAYTPGVALVCQAIHEDENLAYKFTSKGNEVAIISNGTAVLGLGNIGAIASKPVMEGKAFLFKYLAGIDAVDVEVDINDTEKFIEFLQAIAPSYGGINLEDVAAPECFAIDNAARDKLDIPFFHDDQSGTAVVTTAAIQNALKLANKELKDAKIVVSGAGAAALSCVDFLLNVGAQIKNIYIFDSKGLIHSERELDEHKFKYSQQKDQTLNEALVGADIFLGLSKGNLLKGEDIAQMAKDPIILAMANPIPEIMPDEVQKFRPDAIVGTGRSDFPNQVNNVLCFPFLFRGALDVRAKHVSLNMQLACCNAIIEISQNSPNFDKEHIVLDAFNPILIYSASYAVAQAAIKENNAQAALPENYNDFLDSLLYGSTLDKNCAMPKINDDRGTNLIDILKIHGITKKINKTLHILSQEEIIEEAKKISHCTLVFENMKIGYNQPNLTLETKDLIETITHSPSLFIGLITEDKLLFNSANRIWYAHKLCMGEFQND